MQGMIQYTIKIRRKVKFCFTLLEVTDGGV